MPPLPPLLLPLLLLFPPLGRELKEEKTHRIFTVDMVTGPMIGPKTSNNCVLCELYVVRELLCVAAPKDEEEVSWKVRK
jgi:hypothetical protein